MLQPDAPPAIDPAALAALVRQLVPKREGPELRLRQGVVQATGNGLATIRPGGSEDPEDDLPEVPYHEHLGTLTVGEAVEILANGADWRVIGRVRRSPITSAHRVLLTDGNRSRSNATWAVFDAGLDMRIRARAGQFILYGVSANAGAATFQSYFDVVTWVNDAAVANLSGSTFAMASTTGFGGLGLLADSSNISQPVGAVLGYRLTAADVALFGTEESTSVLVRVVHRNATASSRVFAATADSPFHVWVAAL